MKTKKVIAFDIDETLVDRPENLRIDGKEKYIYCFPIQHNINICNSLYEAGHEIILFTARGMTTYNGDVKKVYDELYEFTKMQMQTFGIKFHKLVMGKINYDILIDDKAMNVVDLSYMNLRLQNIYTKL